MIVGFRVTVEPVTLVDEVLKSREDSEGMWNGTISTFILSFLGNVIRVEKLKEEMMFLKHSLSYLKESCGFFTFDSAGLLFFIVLGVLVVIGVVVTVEDSVVGDCVDVACVVRVSIPPKWLFSLLVSRLGPGVVVNKGRGKMSLVVERGSKGIVMASSPFLLEERSSLLEDASIRIF